MNGNMPQTLLTDTRTPGFRGALTLMLRPHFSPFRIFIARQQRTVVVLNPKVGTTSFRYVVGRAYREVFGRKDLSNGRYKLFPKARQFPFPPLRDYLHAFSHPDHYQFYCFVRNPYARLKSAWGDKLAFGHESGYPPSIRGKIVEDIQHFAREKGLPGGQTETALPFSTFVAYIEAQQTGKRNHHWDEQYSILFMDIIRYSQIFKMENEFALGMKVVLARLKVPEPWIEEALAQPRNESRKVNEAVFTPELAIRVQHIFEKDFSAFGYDTNSWQGM